MYTELVQCTCWLIYFLAQLGSHSGFRRACAAKRAAQRRLHTSSRISQIPGEGTGKQQCIQMHAGAARAGKLDSQMLALPDFEKVFGFTRLSDRSFHGHERSVNDAAC